MSEAVKVGVIGVGEVGAPMAHSLARRGFRVAVTRRSEAASTALAGEFENVSVHDNQSVVDNADVVILALRPHLAEEVIAPLTFRDGQRIVSVMAGVSLATLSALCAPARDISITIPMAFIRDGGCPLPVFPGPEPLATLFAAENPIIPVAREEAFAQHFAASTVLSAMFTVMIETAEWTGEMTGDAKGAEAYVTALCAGFLGDVPADGEGRLRNARGALAYEGTLHLSMVETLEARGVPEAVQEALNVLNKRLT